MPLNILNDFVVDDVLPIVLLARLDALVLEITVENLAYLLVVHPSGLQLDLVTLTAACSHFDGILFVKFLN